MSTKAPPHGCDCGDHQTHACVAGEFTHVATCAQGHRWYRTDEALPRHKCGVAGCGHKFVAVDPLVTPEIAGSTAEAHEVGRLRGISQAAAAARAHFGGVEIPLVHEIRGLANFPTPAGQSPTDASVHDRILGDP